MTSLAYRAWAFLVRDFREMSSYRLAFFMQLYAPLFQVAMSFFMARMFGDRLPALERFGGDYFEFTVVALGFLGFMTTGMAVFAASIRHGQVTGTLEAMLVTPTSLATVITCSSVFAFVRGAINVVVYLAIAALFGLRLDHANWPAAALMIALSVAAFSTLGILSAGFVLAFKKGNPAAALFGSLSSLLSGVFYTVETLPSWLQKVSLCLPLTYAVDGMRQAVSGVEGSRPFATDALCLAIYTVVVLPISVTAFRLAVRYAKREGSLAQY